MVIPNFFITFVRHSFHTSPLPAHPLSRETASPASSYHQAPHSPHGTRAASRIRARGSLARCTSQRAMLTRHAHTMHPRSHSTHALRATTPRKGLRHTPHAHAMHPRPHSTLALRATTPRKGLRHAVLPPSMKATLLHAPTPASFLRRKREPHNNQNITYYNITCNVYPNRSKDYTKKRGNLFLYRLNLLSLHDES